MEFLFIVIAIVYSIWSEVNKKKEEEVDIDFSELSSLDDFFKPGEGSPGGNKKKSSAKSAPSKPVRSAAEPANYDVQPILARQAGQTRAEVSKRRAPVNYDQLPSLTGQTNYTRVDEANRKAKVNYDNQSALTGVVNYERESAFAVEAQKVEDRPLTSSEAVSSDTFAENFSAGQFRFGTNDMTKAIILAEVLQRYDMSRIYARIPEFKPDED